MAVATRKPHAILAIAYALSRWGSSSAIALYAQARVHGFTDEQVAQAVAKLIELGQVHDDNGRLVWIGEMYTCG